MSALPLLVNISAIPKTSSYLNKPRLLAIHGLFGSKQNWRSTIDHLSTSLGIQVDAVDLRNHGSSSHTLETNVPSMAQDIIDWCQNQSRNSQFILMGHSMGGKVVMELLSKQNIPISISAAIILDISPLSPARNLPLQRTISDIKSYAKAMIEIQEMKLNDRQKISDILGKTVKLESTKQFLLANLQWNDSNLREYLKFRFNVQCMDKSLNEIMNWTPSKIRNDIPILFIVGSKSPYLPEQDFPTIQKMIPNAEFQLVQSGHEVHIEQPEETQSIVRSFIKKYFKSIL